MSFQINSKVIPNSSSSHEEANKKSFKDSPRIVLRSSRSHTEVMKKSIKSHSRVFHKSFQNHPIVIQGPIRAIASFSENKMIFFLLCHSQHFMKRIIFWKTVHQKKNLLTESCHFGGSLGFFRCEHFNIQWVPDEGRSSIFL